MNTFLRFLSFMSLIILLVLGVQNPVQADKKVFYAKGYDTISLKKIKDFDNIKAVPHLMRTYIKKNMPGCDLGSVPPFGSAYAVSDARTIWEIPCYTGAYQGSYVYADSLNANKKHFTFLEFSEPDGSKPRFELLSPKIIQKGSLFISTALSRGIGDCGKREVYQLVPDVGEELLFVLLERREKKNCDGKASPPKSWPVTYQQK